MTERVPLRRQPGGAYLYDLPGLTPYEDAVALMDELAAARSQGAVPDTVIFCEHPPVVTLGASAAEAAEEVRSPPRSRERGIAVAETDRGGRATYHGPGQLVCYPVLDLTDVRPRPARVRRALEPSVIAALAELGVAGGGATRRGVRRRVDAGGREDRVDRRPRLALGDDPRPRPQRRLDLGVYDCSTPAGTASRRSRRSRARRATR